MSIAIDPGESIPVRKLNEYAYCARLFHLMHVEGLWADNEYTADGRWVHRRVDRAIEGVLEGPATQESTISEGRKQGGDLDQEGEPPPEVQRSVSLASHTLGIHGKLDLVATTGEIAVPVETKRGRVPNTPERSWEPERVQLMAQGLLLREHGFTATRGVLYFAASRTRVEVPFTTELEARTRSLIQSAHAASNSTELPDPLVDDPKCNGCSLSGICLPDETNALAHSPAAPEAHEVRRLYPAREDAKPIYIQEQGARVGKRGEALTITVQRNEVAKIPVKDVSELALLGNVSVTPQAFKLLCEANIPVSHFSRGHWFYGITTGITLRNAYDRAAQFAAAEEPLRRVQAARSFVVAKGNNQRTVLRRNGVEVPPRVIKEMKFFVEKAGRADAVDVLLGLEGNISRLYFQSFDKMLEPKSAKMEFHFAARNRRPPRDPVNALLSFGYGLLSKECTTALLAAGLDPYWGLFHEPRHGRPALALDLMEEFRALIVDSAVLTAVNTGAVQARHFVCGANACSLTPTGRKKFIQIYAARLDQLVTHPLFNYRCSWRQVIRLQARLLARWLRGELDEYRGMVTR